MPILSIATLVYTPVCETTPSNTITIPTILSGATLNTDSSSSTQFDSSDIQWAYSEKRTAK